MRRVETRLWWRRRRPQRVTNGIKRRWTLKNWLTFWTALCTGWLIVERERWRGRDATRNVCGARARSKRDVDAGEGHVEEGVTDGIERRRTLNLLMAGDDDWTAPCESGDERRHDERPCRRRSVNRASSELTQRTTRGHGEGYAGGGVRVLQEVSSVSGTRRTSR